MCMYNAQVINKHVCGCEFAGCLSHVYGNVLQRHRKRKCIYNRLRSQLTFLSYNISSINPVLLAVATLYQLLQYIDGSTTIP